MWEVDGGTYGLGVSVLPTTCNASYFIYKAQKNVLSGHQGLVEFPARQVTFHSHLPEGQGPGQVICPLN